MREKYKECLDSHKNAEVRTVLGPVAELCARKNVGRTCGTVTPAGLEGMATAGTLSAVQILLSRVRTVNSAAGRRDRM